MSLEKFETEQRRLAVLQLLAGKSSYTLDETVLAKGLAAQGLAISRDRLKTDLAWMEEQSLLAGNQPGGVWIATLTMRGLDVSRGLTVVPGVARPEPGE